jgi:hypothetical protein
VLTSSQVADVCFTGEHRARMRLAELYALDVLDRFRPRRGGSPVPFHWVLGPLGAALIAAEHGVVVSDVAWRRRLASELAASQRLARKLDGYARLAAAAGHPNWVLFSFPSPRREAEARRVLRHPVVPVATTARADRGAPDGPVWLPAASTGTARVHLAGLAGLPIHGA